MKNRIGVLRAMREITQEELAQALGVTRQTIIAIEKGKHDPSLPLALGIARRFRLPVEKVSLEDDAEVTIPGTIHMPERDFRSFPSACPWPEVRANG